MDDEKKLIHAFFPLRSVIFQCSLYFSSSMFHISPVSLFSCLADCSSTQAALCSGSLSGSWWKELRSVHGTRGQLHQVSPHVLLPSDWLVGHVELCESVRIHQSIRPLHPVLDQIAAPACVVFCFPYCLIIKGCQSSQSQYLPTHLCACTALFIQESRKPEALLTKCQKLLWN